MWSKLFSGVFHLLAAKRTGLLDVCYVLVLTKGVCNLCIYSIFAVKVMRRAVQGNAILRSFASANQGSRQLHLTNLFSIMQEQPKFKSGV